MNIQINTHRITMLDNLVRKALEDLRGIKLPYRDRNPIEFPILSITGDCINGHRSFSDSDFYIRFDAATEMGKLIEFLEKKDVEIGNVAFDGNKNHNGVISPDGKSIKVGCSTVTYEKVEEVYNAMQKIRNNQ